MRDRFLGQIKIERERQNNLPGSEFDSSNGPNDWIAIISRYVAEGAKSKGITPSANDFSDCMIKAASVILAALEHIDHMKKEKRLK